jgi:hypothetical protein
VAGAGLPKWEGTEFVCGNASNVTGNGGESLVRVDGTSVVTDVHNFKTTRGGAAYSVTSPWAGSDISAKLAKAKPNSEVGAVVAGVAYLVRSQPETINSSEVHPGHELQMMIVTQASPAYFRETEVVHSAAGRNEGFTAADRFRVWGRPLEKRRGGVDVEIIPTARPVFINNVWDDPIFYGSSDPSTQAFKQETVLVSYAGQTSFPNALSARPLDPTTVQAWLGGLKLQYGVDYSITGSPIFRDFVYTGIPALKTTDTLEIWYAAI